MTMDGDTIASTLYLSLLALAFTAMYLVNHRQSLGKTLQALVTWGLIFLGAIAVYGLWDRIDSGLSQQATLDGGDTIVVRRQGDSHFHVTLKIDNTDVDFMVDTGATDLVLSKRDAARIGIDMDDLRFLGSAQTANGTVPLARVVLDTVVFEHQTDRNVAAVVNAGEMTGSLLGMSYLSRFGRLEIQGDRLLLTR